MSAIAGIRGQKVDAILTKTSEYYGVPKESILKGIKGKQSGIWQWKRHLVVILFEHTDLDISEIQHLLGYQQYNSVNNILHVFADELSDESYGCQKTKKNHEELVKYLGL
jgi:hypothetical protein